MLGLPEGIAACLFDMDGVLTKTAAVHAAAWTQMFDEFLRARATAAGGTFTPFDTHDDYDEYVDGKPREDGVRDFLASRDITLPEGHPDDPPDAQTVYGLGNRKNALLLQHIKDDGVEVFEGSVRYLEAVQRAGLHRAVVSSSANTEQVLRVTGLAKYFEVRVDGVTIAERHL
ncbi:MAG TPA: HAD family hydrolase, partial [Streptosporangiaceae bacterium]|nr:HAD family hydrolase [Streptosporangiaceae bacterium]